MRTEIVRTSHRIVARPPGAAVQRATLTLAIVAVAASVAAPVAPAPLAAQMPGYEPVGGEAVAQAPPAVDLRIYDIIDAVSAERIEADIRTLVGFGTRNTHSDTLSDTRGIGAARRWIKAEFDRISAECGGCLEVFYDSGMQRYRYRPGIGEEPVTDSVNVVSVVAIKRGTVYPNRYILMSGDIDSRASRGRDGETDAPGANDNASGMAGTIEAARVLSRYDFPTSIVFTGLSGEEQGLWGGEILAERAVAEGWDIVGVLNNDMIGNIEGVDRVIENNTFRVFSQPTPVDADEEDWADFRRYGGEVDGPSRQLARYVARIADTYFPNLEAIMIYRLDRFGRGGHHTPFNNAGFAGVRIMETHEYYPRQHQDVRVEDGIFYGDVIEGVNFDYARKLTALNAAVLASIAWAPPAPAEAGLTGANQGSAEMCWDPVDDPGLAGYKVYWRATTAPQWERSRFVPAGTTRWTTEGVIIDNYYFGLASVGKSGNESPVVFGTRARCDDEGGGGG